MYVAMNDYLSDFFEFREASHQTVSDLRFRPTLEVGVVVAVNNGQSGSASPNTSYVRFKDALPMSQTTNLFDCDVQLIPPRDLRRSLKYHPSSAHHRTIVRIF